MTKDASNTPHIPRAAAPAPPADAKERARARLAAGEGLYNEEKYAESLAEFEAALALDPRSAEAHKLRGDALGGKFRYEEAIAAYDKALGEDVEAEKPDTRAEAFYQRGEVLYNLRRFEAAAESFRAGAPLLDKLSAEADAALDHENGYKYEARSGDLYNSLGFSLFALKRYDEARAELEVAIAKGRKYPYAYHSLASLLWAQGRYAEARHEWDAAYRRYDGDAMLDEARAGRWSGHFINFGNLLHEVYGDLKYAEKMYREALDMLKQGVPARVGLLNLLIEKAGSADCRADSYCKAKRVYEEAKAILTERLSGARDLDSMIMFGELDLAWNDYDGSGRWREEEGKLAERWLTEALRKDEEDGGKPGYTRTAKPAASLGVLHARRKNYKKAVDFFEQALKIEHDDLTLRSNLAEAYLRDKQYDEAEREYRYITGMAPEHVESMIGLGEVYLARGDAGDPDMYEQAAEKLKAAVGLAEKGRGSKRLKRKELAKVHYLRAYAMVKSFEGSTLLRDQNLLWSARTDFKACARHDPEYYHALRAVEKIEQRLSARTPQRLLEKYGPFLILSASIIVFALAQWSFYYKSDNRLGAAEYTALTFGSLALMVASSYLPQILKLKFAGLELEKNNVDQVATLSTLGITKGV